MLGRRKSKKNSVHPIIRFVRSFMSVVVLTALVLGVTLGAKELYAVDSARFGKISSNILAKLHLKVDEEQVGEIAGKFAERISQTNLGSGVSSSRPLGENDANVYAAKDVLVEIAVLSDIHDDLDNLNSALEKVKSRGIEYVFILGDVTSYGDVKSLSDAKNILDRTGLRYFAIPGDHDLAKSLSNSNFVEVFGEDYGKIDIKGYKFVYFNNAANFTKIAPEAISWLEKELPDTDFLMLSQPLFTEGLTSPFNNIFMGSTKDVVTDAELLEKQKIVRDQGVLLLSLVRDSNNIKCLIAGDHHKSSSTKDTVRSSLIHRTVGAITSQLNEEYSQKVIQSSRLGVLSIFQNGGYDFQDIVLD